MAQTTLKELLLDPQTAFAGVAKGDEPLVVLGEGDTPSVVVISLEDFRKYDTTIDLLRPGNGEGLLRSIAQLEAGRGQVRDIDV